MNDDSKKLFFCFTDKFGRGFHADTLRLDLLLNDSDAQKVMNLDLDASVKDSDGDTWKRIA